MGVVYSIVNNAKAKIAKKAVVVRDSVDVAIAIEDCGDDDVGQSLTKLFEQSEISKTKTKKEEEEEDEEEEDEEEDEEEKDDEKDDDEEDVLADSKDEFVKAAIVVPTTTTATTATASPLFKFFTEKGVYGDILETHILHRAKPVDLMFLSWASPESRATVKSLKPDLLERCVCSCCGEFNVEQLSSISTLALAFDGWSGSRRSLEKFCQKVCLSGKLELVVWTRENAKCPWDHTSCASAAQVGAFDVVKYCVDKACPLNEEVCATAAEVGNLEILKYLREVGGCDWDRRTTQNAVRGGFLDVLKYCVTNWCAMNGPCEFFNNGSETGIVQLSEIAAWENEVECLRYLIGSGIVPKINDISSAAACSPFGTEALEYCIDVGVPIDDQTLYNAAANCNLESVQLLIETHGIMYDEDEIVTAAVRCDCVEILEYLKTKGCTFNNISFVELAGENASMKSLKFLQNSFENAS
jgi:hypothetical protein